MVNEPHSALDERKGGTAVVIARLLVLLVATAAFAGAIVSAERNDQAGAQTAQRYVCPMHPQVVANEPGDCPICNMALVPAQAGERERKIVATRRVTEEVKRRVVTQVVRAPAWLGADGTVSAVLYKESLAELAPGALATFFRSAQPARPIPVRLSSEPAEPWDTSTVRARFTSDQTPSSERDMGWLELAARAQELLVVPESAVLYAADGAYVLAAAQGTRSFTRRRIEVGRKLDSGSVAERSAERLGGVVVLSGLGVGERVVSGDTFFLDAERRLQEAQGNQAEVLE